MKFSIRLLYLYLFSFVGLLVTIIGGIQLVDLGLKTYVFRVSDYTYFAEPVTEGKLQVPTAEIERRNREQEANQRKRQVSGSLAMIIVGVPVYLYHWKMIKKEKQN